MNQKRLNKTVLDALKILEETAQRFLGRNKVAPSHLNMRHSSTLIRYVWLLARHIFQRSISPTCLQTAFTCTDPKSVKIQSSCKYLFALWGSARIKAACKMLMKLTPERG